MVICLFSFCNSLIKIVSKCCIALLANISGILNTSFIEFAFNFTRFGDVKSAPILLRYVGCW